MSELACDACLTRAWLLQRLAGNLDVERARIWELLALGPEELIAAVGGAQSDAVSREHREFGSAGARRARERAAAAGLELLCRCEDRYPASLRQLPAPPAVLHIAGGLQRFLGLCGQDPVAIVGSRNASAYGRGVARSLGGGIGACGMTVISGMARGIDTEAHTGTLEAGGGTVAVLPGPANVPVPVSARRLHARVAQLGATVSEVPPDTPVRNWMYPARNRIIAALARFVVVVEAAARSGSLRTAEAAASLGRPLGAVPGQVTNPRAAGSNALLAGGARLVRDVQDVLDAVHGVGARAAPLDPRPSPSTEQSAILSAIAGGTDTVGALVSRGIGGERCLSEVAALELAGRLRRGAGGRLAVIP